MRHPLRLVTLPLYCSQPVISFASIVLAIVLQTVLLPAVGAAAEATKYHIGKLQLKNEAPFAAGTLSFTFPHNSVHIFGNGLKLVVIEDHRAPVARFGLRIKGAGSVSERSNQRGIANLALGAVAGFDNYHAFRTEMVGLGVGVNTAVPEDADYSAITISGMSHNYERWIGSLLGLVAEASANERDIERFKRVYKVAIQQQARSPSVMGRLFFRRQVLPNHPAGRPLPNIGDFEKLSRSAVNRWLYERYRPDRTVAVLVGDVRRSIATKVVGAQRWLPSKQRTTKIKRPRRPDIPRSVTLVDRRESPQATVYLGNVAPPLSEKDSAAVTVANRLLGGSPMSLLYTAIRHKSARAYSISSRYIPREYGGLWMIETQVAPSDVRTVVSQILDTLRRLIRARELHVELGDTKQGLTAGLAFELEDPAAVLKRTLDRESYGLGHQYWSRFVKRVQATEHSDIRRVVSKYLNPKRISLTVVGDAGRLKKSLESMGPIHLVEPE